jgi:hypothetical protein
MTEQQNINWLEEESKKLTIPTEYEELPSLKLTPNVIADITIDFSKPFQEWVSPEDGGKKVTKKIIPVVVNGQRMNWWLNVKNPVYREIVNAGKSGQTKFKVLQTGTQANTKYVLVK